MDIAAVVAAATPAGCSIFGSSFLGPSVIEFAAAAPRNVHKLILYGTTARIASVFPRDLAVGIANTARNSWDLAIQMLTTTDPEILRETPTAQAEISDSVRRSITGETMARWILEGYDSDAAAAARRIAVPTLIMHRIDDTSFPFAEGQNLAALIPGSRLVALPGRVHQVYYGDARSVVAAANSFLDDRAGTTHDAMAPEVSSTIGAFRTPHAVRDTAVILFADIVDSTALTERLGDDAFRERARHLEAALRATVRDRSGTPIEGKLRGDGVLATFSSAARAIEAALACGKAGEELGLPLHLGLHAGDVIREQGNVFGGAVNIAARISALSSPGEVLVSDTIRSLARTSAGVSFTDRGEHALKGMEEPVRVYAVSRPG